jgi:hypothetical protein
MGTGAKRILQWAQLGTKVEWLAIVSGVKAVVERIHGGPCGGCGKRKTILNGEAPKKEVDLSPTTP